MSEIPPHTTPNLVKIGHRVCIFIVSGKQGAPKLDLHVCNSSAWADTAHINLQRSKMNVITELSVRNVCLALMHTLDVAMYTHPCDATTPIKNITTITVVSTVQFIVITAVCKCNGNFLTSVYTPCLVQLNFPG